MARPSAGSGMKRQVSTTWAIIIILVVIALAFLIGLGGPLWRNLTAPKTQASEIGAPGEFILPGDMKRLAQERLGASLGLLPPAGSKSTGLPVLEVSAGAASELQKGDIITGINGVAVGGGAGIRALATETNKVQVGKPMTLEVERDGRKISVTVTRRASTKAPEPTGGRGGRRSGTR